MKQTVFWEKSEPKSDNYSKDKNGITFYSAATYSKSSPYVWNSEGGYPDRREIKPGREDWIDFGSEYTIDLMNANTYSIRPVYYGYGQYQRDACKPLNKVIYSSGVDKNKSGLIIKFRDYKSNKWMT